MTVQVRRIEPGQEADVLAAAALFDRPPDEQSTRAYLADDRNYLFLAFLDGVAVGFLRATELRRLDGPERQMFLYEIDVDEAYQRRGIGKALIGAIDAVCREQGFAEMFVLTNRSNTAAMRLYESTGAHTESDDEQMLVWTYQDGFVD
jgi:ribosomal protein S18 acetylase RimI-like enzyme